MQLGMVQQWRSRLVSFLSLLACTSLILSYLWWGRFLYSHSAWLVLTYFSIVLIVIFNHLYHGDSAVELGLRVDNSRKAFLWFGLPTLSIALLVSAAGLLYGSAQGLAWSSLAIYLLWASLQQFLLQNFLLRRSREVLSPVHTGPGVGKPGPILLAAALFALFHLPNVVLSVLTFLGALLWCSLFSRIPSLPAAILSQTVLTTVLLLFFKTGPLNQFEIGQPGHRYEYYGGGVKVAAGHDAEGRAFVAAVPGPDRGRRSLVRIFTPEGVVRTEWLAFEEFDFSAEIAVGDLGFDPGDEIVVSTGPGRENPPVVRVFSSEGLRLLEIRPEGAHHRYGAWVSVACGRIYVTPGPGPGTPQSLLEFSAEGKLSGRWEFPDLGLQNSLRATALCDATGASENGPGPSRILLWGTDISVNPSTIFIANRQGRLLSRFETLTTTFGVNLALFRRPGLPPAVLVAPGPLRGYPPLTAAFDLQGNRLWDFSPFDDPDNCGSNVATIDLEGDGQDEILLGEGVGEGRPATIRLFDAERQPIRSWKAFPD